MKYKIGDWVSPTDPVVNGINYGYNLRLVIDISFDGEDFITTCDAFGIEKDIWNIYNTEFAGRITLEE